MHAVNENCAEKWLRLFWPKIIRDFLGSKIIFSCCDAVLKCSWWLISSVKKSSSWSSVDTEELHLVGVQGKDSPKMLFLQAFLFWFIFVAIMHFAFLICTWEVNVCFYYLLRNIAKAVISHPYIYIFCFWLTKNSHNFLFSILVMKWKKPAYFVKILLKLCLA